MAFTQEAVRISNQGVAMKGLVLASAAVIGSGLGIKSYIADRVDINQTVPAAQEGIVVVRVPGGDIDIQGWDRSEVQVQGTVPAGDDRFELWSEHGHVEVRVIPDLGADPSQTSLTIMVPEHSSLDIETDAAGVDIDGVSGVVRLATGSGNIRINGNPMGIVARSESGDIDIAAQRTPGVAHSEEGTVRLRGGAQDLIADRMNRRMERRLRQMNTGGQADHEDCDHFEQFAQGFEQNWEQYGHRWADLGMEIGSMVQEILNDVDMHFDLNRHDGGFSFDLSGDIDIDDEALEDMFDNLGEYFEEFGDELGESMEELGEDLEKLGRDLKKTHRERRRGRI